MKKGIFFQGSAKTSNSEADMLKKVFEWCRQNKVKVLTGSHGNIVELAHQSGAKVVSYFCKSDKGKIPSHGHSISTYHEGYPAYSWGSRLGSLVDTADGVIFFPGEMGTLAHLFPFLAFASKKQTVRVAIVGWGYLEELSFKTLIRNTNSDNIRFFSLEDAKQAVIWATNLSA